ncbi:hypothetical protein MSAN_00927000 [Mycena sanguinolenta]|uniref:Secreted protein n=1 Tax=Mycena sanguinolenta TaxID=230812 RepID=A0A8H6YWV4_9AGAR|nr:hypothetical protein MSAN_00927000 [Mycena sanguinolenta]
MSGADEAGAACCGLCLLCGFGALSNWCNTGSCSGRGGRHIAGCCGWCCDRSFDEDKWERDKAELRTEQAQPAPTEPMSLASSEPLLSEPTNPMMAPAGRDERPSR